MNLNERQVGSVTVVALDGPLKLGDATTRLRDKINSVLHQGQRQIVLDLSKVDSIDSAGLGELIRSYVSAKSQGGVVRLASLSSRADSLLVTTKLDLVLERFGTVDEAVASFGG